jgi:hypothetical protein
MTEKYAGFEIEWKGNGLYAIVIRKDERGNKYKCWERLTTINAVEDAADCGKAFSYVRQEDLYMDKI